MLPSEKELISKFLSKTSMCQTMFLNSYQGLENEKMKSAILLLSNIN